MRQNNADVSIGVGRYTSDAAVDIDVSWIDILDLIAEIAETNGTE